MSLLHWWPLNGDTKDYGLNPITLSSFGTISYTNSGKIGKGLSCTGSNGLYFNGDLGVGNTHSISSWFFVPSGQNNGWGAIAILLNNGSDSDTKFGLYANENTSSLRCQVSANGSYYSQIAYTQGVWHNLISTYDGTTLKGYLDGVLVKTTTITSAELVRTHFSIGCRSTSTEGAGVGRTALFVGTLNDIRIYDNVLSQKEVKEISKGLVLHYNFEDEYIEGTTNLFPSNYQNSFYISGDSSSTFNASGNWQNSWTQQGTYTLSGWYKLATTDSATNPKITLYAIYSDSSTKSYVAGVSAIKDGQWHKFSITGTTNSSKTLTVLGGWLFDYSSAGSTRNCACKEVQLEQKDHATPYTNGTRSAGLVYDNSGYQRNATPVNNPQILEDSGSGLHCVDLTSAANGYFDLGTGTLNFITSGTVSFWAKYTDSNYKMILGANDSGSKYLAANTPNGSSSSGNWYGMVSTSNCYCDGEVYSKPKIDSQWHHYCFTSLNFSNWGDLKYFLCIYANNYNNSFQFHGYLADFKVYSTSLSANDVLLEYQRKASIDKNNNLITRDFVETGWTGTSVLDLSNISDVGDKPYVDKSLWAGSLIDTTTINAKLQPSTKYYIRYRIQRLAYPVSHTYTTQAWAYTMLYNNSSSVGCAGLTKDVYTSLKPGESIWVTGSFTTPSSLSGWRMVFYSARWSGSSSDWGTNAELETVRISEFSVSSTQFTHEDTTIKKSGVLQCAEVHEVDESNVKIFKAGEVRASSIEEL